MIAYEQLWTTPPSSLSLSKDEVHVWSCSLNLSRSFISSLRSELSGDELDRAERFYFEIDQRRFIARRGLLRVILGRYLKINPRQLRFHYNEFGKAAMVPISSQQTISFNLSHSHGLALYAFGYGRKIGIDLERIRTDISYEQIAERFFSPQEAFELRNLPAIEKSEAFFNCWTRKEAYIKATGRGLSTPLSDFEVSLIPGSPARLMDAKSGLEETAGWSLRELMVGSNYVAALAVEGDDWQLKCWRFCSGKEFFDTVFSVHPA